MYLGSRKSERRPATFVRSDSGRPECIPYLHTDSSTPPLEVYAKTPTFLSRSIRIDEGPGSMTLIAATIMLEMLVAVAGGCSSWTHWKERGPKLPSYGVRASLSREMQGLPMGHSWGS